MTYKEVLDDLTDLLSRHRMIVTWGYGNLSDLVTPFRKTDSTDFGSTTKDIYNIDYPYAFLQPTSHNLSKGKSTFNFNLIMMEQCEDTPEAVIGAQSNCYRYIKDVLAEIYYNFDQKYDFNLNSTVNPFKEKYNDTVSGMTAAISIEVQDVLDDCIAPFAPKYDNEYVYVYENGFQDIGSDPGENDVIQARTYVKNPDGQWETNRFDTNATRTYRIEVTGYVSVIPETGDTIAPIKVKEFREGLDQFWSPNSQIGWPETVDAPDNQRFHLIWEEIELSVEHDMQMIVFQDKPFNQADLRLQDVEIRYYLS